MCPLARDDKQLPCIDVMVGDTDNIIVELVLVPWVSEQIARHENFEV